MTWAAARLRSTAAPTRERPSTAASRGKPQEVGDTDPGPDAPSTPRSDRPAARSGAGPPGDGARRDAPPGRAVGEGRQLGAGAARRVRRRRGVGRGRPASRPAPAARPRGSPGARARPLVQPRLGGGSARDRAAAAGRRARPRHPAARHRRPDEGRHQASRRALRGAPGGGRGGAAVPRPRAHGCRRRARARVHQRRGGLRRGPAPRRTPLRARGRRRGDVELAARPLRARGRGDGRRSRRQRLRVGRPGPGARARNRSADRRRGPDRWETARCGATCGWGGTSSSSTGA